VRIANISDRTFLMHLGGKIEIPARSRSGPATTSAWPTPRGWPGSASRSRTTRAGPSP
jgi:hypothetical protein